MYNAPSTNTKINYRLWVIMLCQCSFSNYNKCATLAWDVDNKRGYACVEQGVYENSVLPAQFCCELKSALKNEVYKK